MKKLASVLSTWLICAIIMILGGCKTKKAVVTETNKSTYNSIQRVEENSNTHYSLVDTTKVEEFTSIVREYVFDSLAYHSSGSFAHDINVGSKVPIVEVKADGSVIINHGLKAIRERKECRRSENKHVSEKKDSMGNNVSNTNVRATEIKKRRDKQVERVQMAEPFKWWQLLFALCVPFAIIAVLLYLKANPFVENFFKRIRNSLKSE